MKAVIQRVKHAQIEIPDAAGSLRLQSRIEKGLLTLIGIAPSDTPADVEALIRKITDLRIFEDDAGKMNRSLKDVGGSHLIVSQFTLYADTHKGNRPSFLQAARPEIAQPLYEYALDVSRKLGVPTEAGVFGADMKITLLNDGPVTLCLETGASADARLS